MDRYKLAPGAVLHRKLGRTSTNLARAAAEYQEKLQQMELNVEPFVATLRTPEPSKPKRFMTPEKRSRFNPRPRVPLESVPLDAEIAKWAPKGSPMPADLSLLLRDLGSTLDRGDRPRTVHRHIERVSALLDERKLADESHVTQSTQCTESAPEFSSTSILGAAECTAEELLQLLRGVSSLDLSSAERSASYPPERTVDIPEPDLEVSALAAKAELAGARLAAAELVSTASLMAQLDGRPAPEVRPVDLAQPQATVAPADSAANIAQPQVDAKVLPMSTLFNL